MIGRYVGPVIAKSQQRYDHRSNVPTRALRRSLRRHHPNRAWRAAVKEQRVYENHAKGLNREGGDLNAGRR